MDRLILRYVKLSYLFNYQTMDVDLLYLLSRALQELFDELFFDSFTKITLFLMLISNYKTVN